MTREHDWDAETDAAWVAFRGRLADHVAEMDDGDVLCVELVDDEEPGAAPYVQACAFGDDLVYADAASNAFLHERFRLTDEQERAMLELGWEAPTAEPGWENFHLTCERREADRVAVLMVRTLREVHGVVHPAFLDAGGLEAPDDDVVVPTCAGMGGPDHEEEAPVESSWSEVTMPHSHEHLQELVDEAMRVVFPDLRKDDDGDVPIRAGRSTAFVRVVGGRPAVEVYAEIVVEPDDDERLLVELALLNASHPSWKFLRCDDVVVMRHELWAVPFSGFQLRAVVDRFLDDVDRIAGELVARVGGRRFLDPRPTAEHDDESIEDDEQAADLTHDELFLAGLLELLHLGRPRAATVAGLYSGDRLTIIRQIVGVRTGRLDCEEHDPDVVLHALRRALRLVSDGKPEPVPLPPKPASVQTSLLSDAELGEDSLDLGWPA